MADLGRFPQLKSYQCQVIEPYRPTGNDQSNVLHLSEPPFEAITSSRTFSTCLESSTTGGKLGSVKDQLLWWM